MAQFIINADDYGISNKFDKGIIVLIKKGYISSASVIIREDISKISINRILRYKNKISRGLHFDYRQNSDKDDNYQKIYKALEEQYGLFYQKIGFYPTHLDKHNREITESELKVICDFSIEKKIPIRIRTRGSLFSIFETIYANKIKITDFLYNISSIAFGLDKIKNDLEKNERNGDVYEVISHPGFFDKEYKGSKYNTNFNQKREDDYQNILRLGRLLKRHKQKIISFREFSQYLTKNIKEV